MTDTEIIDALSTQHHAKAFKALYQHFPMIQRYVLKNNGNDEDAKDLFQNALLSFYQKVTQGNYVHKAKISTFLFAICRNNWNKHLTRNKERHFVTLEDKHQNHFSSTPTFSDHTPHQDLKEFLQEKITELGDPCKSILTFHEFYKLSMTNIAKKMGYKNDNTVRQQKYKCLARLRKLIPNALKEAYLTEIN